MDRSSPDFKPEIFPAKEEESLIDKIKPSDQKKEEPTPEPKKKKEPKGSFKRFVQDLSNLTKPSQQVEEGESKAKTDERPKSQLNPEAASNISENITHARTVQEIGHQALTRVQEVLFDINHAPDAQDFITQETEVIPLMAAEDNLGEALVELNSSVEDIKQKSKGSVINDAVYTTPDLKDSSWLSGGSDGGGDTLVVRAELPKPEVTTAQLLATTTAALVAKEVFIDRRRYKKLKKRQEQLLKEQDKAQELIVSQQKETNKVRGELREFTTRQRPDSELSRSGDSVPSNVNDRRDYVGAVVQEANTIASKAHEVSRQINQDVINLKNEPLVPEFKRNFGYEKPGTNPNTLTQGERTEQKSIETMLPESQHTSSRSFRVGAGNEGGYATMSQNNYNDETNSDPNNIKSPKVKDSKNSGVAWQNGAMLFVALVVIVLLLIISF